MKKTSNTPQIIINGNAAKFTGNTFINNLECNIRLENMGKRELNNLYKSSESVRKAAKKKAQEQYFEEAESYLYKAIDAAINLMKIKVSNIRDESDLLIDREQLPKFKYDDTNGVSSLAHALQVLSINILSNAINLSEKDIKKAFIENPCGLFREENENGAQVSYKVEDNNIYKVIKELA